MSKKRLFTLSLLFLFFTIPWVGLLQIKTTVFGFPLWAIYSLFAGLMYCIIIAWLIERNWEITHSDSEKSSHE
ncbi:MAG: hypothetical protein ISR83_00685 [Candidatus Marinimicrobia bacterium]|nr:hypothetical protein [Candidatus Neomarinimicrobiota bacterium]